MALIQTPEDLDFDLADLAEVPAPDRVLLADPEHFEVAYAINPHMRDEGGELKRVDRPRARAQWQALREACERLGLAVDVLPPLEGHPDLVFCANQVLPVPAAATPHGRGAIVPAHMASQERRGEVPHVVEHFRAAGHRIEPLHTTREPLEGMGDGLWHPGRRMLWAGIGKRSSEAAWREIAARYRLPVVALELVDPAFYHLDTCLAALSESTCLWLPQALSRGARKRVSAVFEHCIEADEVESRELLACNAWSPDGQHVLIQRGATKTLRRVAAAGFDVIELDTDEFGKSGGSVFCMKLAHWSPARAG